MCGRFSQSSPPEEYAEFFGMSPLLSPCSRGISTSLNVIDLEHRARYNVAPSTDILACLLSPEGNKELVPLHWGLVPSWSKGMDKRYSMINARAETVASKPAYRVPFRRHRCLIPADGFFEWHSENGKQPYYIHHKDNTPLAFAGLWDHWQDDAGDSIDSCTIIVCEANTFMQPIHERMPVILKPDVFEPWLENTDTDYLQSLLQPYAESDIEMYPVSRFVNNPKNDGKDLVERLVEKE